MTSKKTTSKKTTSKKTSKKSPTKKISAKKATSKIKQQGMSQGMRVLLAAAFLVCFVIVCVVLLIGLRSNLNGAVRAFVYEEPTEGVSVAAKPLSYADVRQLIENQLVNGPDSMGWQLLTPHDGVDVRKIFGAFPSQVFLAELAQHISQTGSPAQLKVSRDKGLIRLFWNDNLQMELRYEVAEAVEVTPQSESTARIAIIMDDIGGSLSAVEGLLGLSFPVTPSILPGTSHVTRAAELLQQHSREYLIHIPMEPLSYPSVDPGDNALLVELPEEQIRARVRSYIDELPGAVGGNNHMGSRYTKEIEPMRIVLDELKAHNLFFIDSRTIGSSVAFNEARKMGIKTATRNIFLDNKSDVAYIRAQLRKMVEMAGSDREIIAICHPHQETFDALRLEADWLIKQPVEFVAASKLVHSY
jgi:polysaccharide deacetylase 2 family uncharacterized protein YibQ